MDRFRRSSTKFTSSWGQPLDRVSLLVMAMLSLAIAALIVFGDRTAPRIRNFSWQDQQIGAEDTAFTLTFNRPMNQKSVEDNLQLTAIISEEDRRAIPGRISWAGQLMAFTLNQPAPYGYEFELALQNAHDRFSATDKPSATIEPFTAHFHSRDRAFFYIGIEGAETGRLVLHNLTRKEKRILTPEDLIVIDYKSYPEGDRVLFSATQRSSQQQGILDQKLYTVPTGLEISDDLPENQSDKIASDQENTENSNPTFSQPPPILMLDSGDYQNLKFDLSPDGQTIVIYRVNRQDPTDFGLWVLTPDSPPHPLETEPGGDFLITPDSQAIAHLQGEGLALLPLNPEPKAQNNGNQTDITEPLDFLPQYGTVLNFSPDGTKAAMVQFSSELNQPKRSLFLVTNQGQETELLVTNGSILDAQFDPTGSFLYCLVTQLQASETYLEQPYLAAINLTTSEQTNLLLLPPQQNIHMSLAPDGLGILFDQVESTLDPTVAGTLIRSDDGSLITNSQLWFFPLSFDEQGELLLIEPDLLPMAGLYPQWLP